MKIICTYLVEFKPQILFTSIYTYISESKLREYIMNVNMNETYITDMNEFILSRFQLGYPILLISLVLVPIFFLPHIFFRSRDESRSKREQVDENEDNFVHENGIIYQVTDILNTEFTFPTIKTIAMMDIETHNTQTFHLSIDEEGNYEINDELVFMFQFISIAFENCKSGYFVGCDASESRTTAFRNFILSPRYDHLLKINPECQGQSQGQCFLYFLNLFHLELFISTDESLFQRPSDCLHHILEGGGDNFLLYLDVLDKLTGRVLDWNKKNQFVYMIEDESDRTSDESETSGSVNDSGSVNGCGNSSGIGSISVSGICEGNTKSRGNGNENGEEIDNIAIDPNMDIDFKSHSDSDFLKMHDSPFLSDFFKAMKILRHTGFFQEFF